MPRAITIGDLRDRARRRLPRMLFDYVDGGSFAEATLRANETAFEAVHLQQRVLRDVSTRSLAATVLGQAQTLPLLLGPVGFAGLLWPRGEVLAARAARAAGIGMCLSAMSICSLDEVVEVGGHGMAFQSYVFRDRSVSEAMIARARSYGVGTLVLTVDAAVSGLRECDAANGFRLARRLGLRAVADLAAHPGWCLRMAGARPLSLGNVASQPGEGFMAQVSRQTSAIDPALAWGDVAWFRANWPGRLILKGIMAPDDALRAADAGADGIVVSNHGGRQLDGTCSSLAALGPVACALGGRIEVLFDGGIRRGSHVIKALALGADAVLLGRAQAWGLAANGAEGVSAAIGIIAREMDLTLALMGLASLHELRAAGPDALVPAGGPQGAAAARFAGPMHDLTAGATASAA